MDLHLARRLVARPQWRWGPGMGTTEGERVLWVFQGRFTLATPRGAVRQGDGALLLPDLADPATVGHLLELLAESAERYALGLDGRGGYSVSWSSSQGSWSYREPRSLSLGQVVARALLEVWGGA